MTRSADQSYTLVSAAVFAFLCGCSSSTVTAGQTGTCTQNATQECVGAGMCHGVQTCADGKQWTACDCSSATGGSSAASTSSVDSATGGAASASASGGAVSTGGVPAAAGESATGGADAAGGASATGGYVATGGSSHAVAACGDNKLTSPEICDGTLFGALSCGYYGFSGGSLSCNSCTLSTDTCTDNNVTLIKVGQQYGDYVVASITLTGATPGGYTFTVASGNAGRVNLVRNNNIISILDYVWTTTIGNDPSNPVMFNFVGYFSIGLIFGGSGTENLYNLPDSIFNGKDVLRILP